MARKQSTGECAACHKIVAKSAITRHLAKCEELQHLNQQEPEGKSKLHEGEILHLSVEGRYLPDYWLHLEVPLDASLKDLDNFLRNIWLECCGHLSMFTINEVNYSVAPDPEFGDRSMSGKVGKLLLPGTAATYEYDFGSTTELFLRMWDTRTGKYRSHAVRMLARNLPPDRPCSVCGAPATYACSMCSEEDEAGWVCDKHAEEHECGEDMLLPVVNSPRVGVCAYGT